MRKGIVLISICIGLFLQIACKPEKVETAVSFSKNEIICSPAGSDAYFLISSNRKWSIKSNDDWCEVSHSNRLNKDGNDILVLVRVDENIETTTRITNLEITAETGEIFTIKVEQKGIEDIFLIPSMDTIRHTFEGEEGYFILATSHKWEISVEDDWCEVSHVNRVNDKGNDIIVLIKTKPNPEITERKTKVQISSEIGLTAELVLIQDGEPDVEPQMLSFGFKASLNSGVLISDISCSIQDTIISVLIPHVLLEKVLIPSFTFEGDSVVANEEPQQTDQNEINFSSSVRYTVYNKTGDSKSYLVNISSFTGLPVVFINTENRKLITSKVDYLNATIRIYEDLSKSNTPIFSSSMEIRGRGNSTWLMPKKPYKLKFDKKTSLLDLPGNKHWVLLANYADKTALRNETAFYMGRLSVLEWTPRTKFVEVFMNDVYEGTYQICEQIKIAEERVNVTDDGYVLEVDEIGRMEPEDVYFQSTRLLFNIKEPDEEWYSDRYNWIKNFVNEAENALYSENFKDPEQGYAKYLDISSFVDWYLINEITKNNDAIMFSSCYMNIAPNGKLKMGPLWDYDLALGNVNYNNNADPTGLWIATAPWFEQLLKDPAFVEEVKIRFNYFKSQKDNILNAINNNAEYLKWSVIENNNMWKTLYTYTFPNYAIWGSYNNEIQCMKDFLIQRFEWLERAFNEM